MLFSEPKIPHERRRCGRSQPNRCFSALQRAENSSRRLMIPSRRPRRGFSALQRAENSSPVVDCSAHTGAHVSVLFSEPKIPHSSSARAVAGASRVSVLFSEPKIPHARSDRADRRDSGVSVLFSEPKIPHVIAAIVSLWNSTVSVLFSEPKIPHVHSGTRLSPTPASFSALQRAENSSLRLYYVPAAISTNVSVLFSEPKIPHADVRSRQPHR